MLEGLMPTMWCISLRTAMEMKKICLLKFLNTKLDFQISGLSSSA